jgi:hypothetical protein
MAALSVPQRAKVERLVALNLTRLTGPGFYSVKESRREAIETDSTIAIRLSEMEPLAKALGLPSATLQ